MEVSMDYNEEELLSHQNPAYDQAAKMFLSKKKMLAWILKRVVVEYKDVSLKDIEETYIEGEPQVSVVPVNPDHPVPQSIKGSRNEDSSPTEGKIVFDILFHARAPVSGELITLIINIEAQKQYPDKYPLIKRGVYYACRALSSEKEREFTGIDYGSICKVYSIWLCMEPPAGEDSSINSYFLMEKQLHGSHMEDPLLYDLINITTIYLGKSDGGDRLISLLRLLFKEEISAADKKELLLEDYDLNLTDDMREELSIMCNLSEGIYERAYRKGAIEERAKINIEHVLKLLKNGVSVSIISDTVDISADEVKRIADQYHISLLH